MKAQQFQKAAYKHIGKLEVLIAKMPEHGLKSEDCQRVVLQQALNEFSYAVNGVEDSDFKKHKDR